MVPTFRQIRDKTVKARVWSGASCLMAGERPAIDDALDRERERESARERGERERGERGHVCVPGSNTLEPGVYQAPLAPIPPIASTAVEPIRHIQDRQSQILALAFT